MKTAAPRILTVEETDAHGNRLPALGPGHTAARVLGAAGPLPLAESSGYHILDDDSG